MAAGLTVGATGWRRRWRGWPSCWPGRAPGAGGPRDLRVDSLMMPEAATPALVEQIEAAGPFGAAAPAPRFAFPDVTVSARRIGESPPAADRSAPRRPAARGDGLRRLRQPARPRAGNPGTGFSPGGRLELNSWGGRTRVQLRWTTRHRLNASPPRDFSSCATRRNARINTAHRQRGPFVYRLGHLVFNQVRGVRLPYGLPLRRPCSDPGTSASLQRSRNQLPSVSGL
jgi:hypothetical protein